MSKSFFSIIFLFSFLLQGCQLSQKVEIPPVPDIGVESDSLNKDLELLLRKSNNTFRIGDDIVLQIHLKSDIQVKSNASFNARLFRLDKHNQKWLEISDFINFDVGGISFGTDEILLDANNPNCVIVLHPIIDDQDDETTLLITIKGAMLTNDTEIGWTGSYTIVSLKP